VIMHWSLVEERHGASNSGSKGVVATTDWGGQRMYKIQYVNSAATNKLLHQNFEKKGVKKRKNKEKEDRKKERKKLEIIRMQIMYFLTLYTDFTMAFFTFKTS